MRLALSKAGAVDVMEEFPENTLKRRLVGPILALVGLVLAGSAYWLFSDPSGSHSLKSFDPDRTADLEVDMWKAYYDKETVRLFDDLVIFTRGQVHYSWATAGQASYHLARAASTFANLKDHYEQVLPDLEQAYTIERNWVGADFDPSAVARAELAWWVARRIPGQNSPEHVGELIAEENALIYGVSKQSVLAASILRAKAGKLRDDGGADADWTEVSRLLHESYRALYTAVQL
jgi:hypothetical protein